ncbi:hypothetical protein J6590_057109 [Homalodisca vitripennis]|nr:hypothetical protein J6590_057109 [Homalodisca vitripennis]
MKHSRTQNKLSGGANSVERCSVVDLISALFIFSNPWQEENWGKGQLFGGYPIIYKCKPATIEQHRQGKCAVDTRPNKDGGGRTRVIPVPRAAGPVHYTQRCGFFSTLPGFRVVHTPVTDRLMSLSNKSHRETQPNLVPASRRPQLSTIHSK